MIQEKGQRRTGEVEDGEDPAGRFNLRRRGGAPAFSLFTFPVLPFSLCLTLAAACSGGSAGDGLDARWKAWQDYAKTYKASDLFPPLEYPKGIDWLACHYESGQTFEQYAKADPVKLTKERNRIVLQPVGEFDAKQEKMLGALREFMAAYFQCKVDIEKAVPLPKEGFRTLRTGPQYLTGSITDGVLKPRLPKDAASFLGLTCADIYPGPGWNFVFGEAYLRERVGVQSFARYYPSFWGEKAPEDADSLVLMRAMKTLTHETGHTFSMEHCTHFACNMCGSNSLAESDRRPVHLCPVCLKKLEWNRGFDAAARYRELGEFYKKYGFKAEAEWIQRRLKELGGR